MNHFFYRLKKKSLKQLKACMVAVTQNMLKNKWTGVEYFVNFSCAASGAHTEIY
jgi:hypothetical protein